MESRWEQGDALCNPLPLPLLRDHLSAQLVADLLYKKQCAVEDYQGKIEQLNEERETLKERLDELQKEIQGGEAKDAAALACAVPVQTSTMRSLLPRRCGSTVFVRQRTLRCSSAQTRVTSRYRRQRQKRSWRP